MEFLTNGPKRADHIVALAHGAGAAMDSPFMNSIAEGLAGHGCRVVRFEFPYMARRRETGKQSPPDRAPKLIDAWKEVVRQLGPSIIIGGKSMGGRIASLVADECGVAGLLCLGYPFHPPGKLDATRIEHLAELRTPTLILQGERDPFGTPDDVTAYPLSTEIELVWLPDGDHSFKPRKSSGRTLDENLAEAVTACIEF